MTEPTLPQRKIDFYFDFIGGGAGDLNPVHLIFAVVLPHDMKKIGKAFPIFVRLEKGLGMQVGCFLTLIWWETLPSWCDY